MLELAEPQLQKCLHLGEIRDCDYSAEADSLSSETPKPHGDTGATLGRNKAAKIYACC
jgi:hypothetical protein